MNKVDPTGTRWKRNKAVAYARRHAENPNYDFYRYFGGNECTKFMSQAMKAGGFSFDRQGGRKWWYSFNDKGFEDDEWTKTWAVTEDFRNYMEENKVRSEWLDDKWGHFKRARTGDLIFVKNQGKNADPNADHAAMVTAGKGKNAKLSYHSNDKLDVPWSDFYKLTKDAYSHAAFQLIRPDPKGNV